MFLSEIAVGDDWHDEANNKMNYNKFDFLFFWER